MQNISSDTDTSKKSPIKVHKTWTAKQALLVSLLAYIVSQVAIAIPIIIFAAVTGESALEDDYLSQPWVSLVLSGVAATGLLATLVLFFRYKHIPLKALGFSKLKLKQVALIPATYIVYILILGVFLGIVSVLFPDFNPDQVQDVGFKSASGWQLLLAFIGLVVIAPVAEEMLFRGFIYKGLKTHTNSRVIVVAGLLISTIVAIYAGPLAGFVTAMLTLLSASIIIKNHKLGAAIFTSMLFGLVHMQWNVAIDTFILSFALIWIFERTNNLWAAIGLHAFKNFVAFVFVFEIIKITTT